MKLKPVLFVLTALALSGCAGLKEQQLAIDQLSIKVNELKASVDASNGRIDDLGNRLTLLQEKVDASRAEIEKLSAASVPAAPPEGLKVVPLAEEPLRYNPGPDQKGHTTRESMKDAEPMYNRGQDLFMAGRYEEARQVFTSFIKAYPRHSLSDNALYWIGEAYYTEKDFEKALEKFAEVSDKYPEENKTPDALLKAGLSLKEMGRSEQANAYFERLLSKYPSSNAAAMARKALKGER
ncbi:MAG TPA: tol-pal system protein YbgF [Deltaproteobacteria bacterium]|nr:MAG: tol-pal system protein YbgF [Deltaproteobacteria bacterium GWA2_55_82]OGQ65013.1 MAG: tol-pal system protein YbgF [Deltaproteobacteria bacterium RIFCSPLOWO2_02_FULL_55_12]OIJ73799.1 MAG: tol-pal system protein YbgF [Deltaproteobacteria bacterium GWC2_55_46]HBG45797.1 tol-pal system protein YbgF [Deltaproteobacteria bacterium]HCY09784.1 tol-pal system protein YbgF [Deltaproteobacteria bacterium]